MASKKKNRKGNQKLRRNVRQDIKAAYKPALAGISQQKESARASMESDRERLGNIYGNLNQTLSGMVPMYAQAAQGIQGNISMPTGAGGPMGGALGALNSTLAATTGAGLQGTLSNLGAGHQASMLQSADLDANILRDYRDFVNELQGTKLELKSQKAQSFLEELNRRRDFRLAKKEQKIREEQFDKSFKRSGNQQRRENRRENQATNWIQKQLSQEEEGVLSDKTQRWRKNAGIPSLKDQIDSISKQLRTETLDPMQVNELNSQLSKLRNELKRAKSKVRSKKRRYVKRNKG